VRFGRDEDQTSPIYDLKFIGLDEADQRLLQYSRW
jgi:hypothetical protein